MENGQRIIKRLWILITIVTLVRAQAEDATFRGPDMCPAASEPGVQTMDIRLPLTKVPKQSTYYVCQRFKVPDDQPYHALAFQPIIDNTQVMHHMILFACPNDVEAGLEPHACGGLDYRCETWLAVWTVGFKGQICTYKNTGVRFGKDSMKYLALQIHWANADLRDDYTDSSGMMVYYTSKLKKYDVGNVQFGQNKLTIPPRSLNFEQSGGCSSSCTYKRMDHPIYLTRTYIHAHHLAVAGSMEQYRDGKLLRKIAYDPHYNYEQPPIHLHDPPVAILPGDEVLVRCWFDSKTGKRERNTTIHWGMGSDAEMCYAFVSYYPLIEGFNQCAQYGKLDLGECKLTHGTFGACDISTFVRRVSFELFPEILEQCDPTNRRRMCSQRCLEPMYRLFDSPCMRGSVGDYFRHVQLIDIRGWARIPALYTTAVEMCSGKIREDMDTY